MNNTSNQFRKFLLGIAAAAMIVILVFGMGGPLTTLSRAAASAENRIYLPLVIRNFTHSTDQKLTVSKSGTGSGTITSNPVGIDCGSTCSYDFNYNTSVTLTAVANAGSNFTGWNGAGCSGTGTCTVIMNAPQSITATFIPPGNQTLTVNKSGTGSGTVTSSPAGINCGSICSYSFVYNASVTLTATPTAPSTFGGWSGAGCSGTSTCNVTLSSAQSVTATFNFPGSLNLTVSKTSTGNGTVTSNPTGIDCGSTCSSDFNYNTSVILTAAASTGSSFAGWNGSGCSGTGTCTVMMDAAKSVTAAFTLNTYSLSISKSGSGTITSNPAGINCGSTCSYSFSYNTSVTLTAVASTGSTFTGWSGSGCSGTGTCTVTMDAAKSVTAAFTLNTYSLSVSKNGAGSGTITSNPAGINCGSTCSYSFSYITSVTLTAIASPGSTFTGWSGSGCSGTGTCMLTMDAAKSVTAAFTLNTYSLSVSKSGTGSGTVTSSPAGINCGSTCSASFYYNASVILTAAPSTDSTFTGWSGSGCSGTDTCTVMMDTAKSVNAIFTLNTYEIRIGIAGEGSGIVTSDPPGIDCGSTCIYFFPSNTVVTLTATPTSPSIFGGWSGAGCSGTGTCIVTMNDVQQVIATFLEPCIGIANCDFESGSNGQWTEYSFQGLPIIYDCTDPYNCNYVIPYSRNWLAWLGGEDNEKSYIEQQITISPSTPYLVYWQWIKSLDYCLPNYDFAEVIINGTTVDKYMLCTDTSTEGWVSHSVDLSAYIYLPHVKLQIYVQTDEINISDLYIDYMTFQASP